MSRELTKSKNALMQPGRKSTPRTLLLCIKRMTETLNIRDVCMAAGICRSTLNYWLQKSEHTDDPKFNILKDGVTQRFHQWFAEAKQDGIDGIFKIAVDSAKGIGRAGTEIGTYRGHVVYKEDPNLIAKGAIPGTPAALMRDNHGNPIPESWAKYDMENMRWILERVDPERFGHKQSIDVKHTGGVLVVGAKLRTADLEAHSKQPIQDIEFEVINDEVGDGNE